METCPVIGSEILFVYTNMPHRARDELCVCMVCVMLYTVERTKTHTLSDRSKRHEGDQALVCPQLLLHSRE